MQILGNNQSQNAMNQARSTENAQQAALQAKQNAIVQKSISGSTPATAQQQMSTGAAARNTAWNNLQNATTPIASALPTSTDNSPTGNAQRRSTSAGNAFNTLTANAAAKEGSYGDWQTQQGIKNADTAQKLAVNNNFSTGDANLLPLEMQVASQKGSKLTNWGSIVSSIGNLAGIASATGAFGAARALPSAAAVGDFEAGEGPVSNAFAATTPAWSTAAAGATPPPIWNNTY